MRLSLAAVARNESIALDQPWHCELGLHGHRWIHRLVGVLIARFQTLIEVDDVALAGPSALARPLSAQEAPEASLPAQQDPGL